MSEQNEFRYNLAIFGVQRHDPGWLYVIRNGDLLKVGKKKNPKRRLHRDAKTWLPDMELIGVKPFWNFGRLERELQCGLANFWYAGEWHKFPDANHSEFLIEGFKEFYDDDIDKNSVDFIYWINGSGMSELLHEQYDRKISLRRWQHELKRG
jgi:hypothetical protein